MSKDQKINGPQECDLFTRVSLLFLLRLESEVASEAALSPGLPPGEMRPAPGAVHKAAASCASALPRPPLHPPLNSKINTSFSFKTIKNQVLGAVSLDPLCLYIQPVPDLLAQPGRWMVALSGGHLHFLGRENT